jgi:hypothetical protein
MTARSQARAGPSEKGVHGDLKARRPVLVACSKTGMGGFVHRGFESLPLRCVMSRDMCLI